MNSSHVDGASSVETSASDLASAFHISREPLLAADDSLYSCIGLEDSVNWEDWVALEREDGKHEEG